MVATFVHPTYNGYNAYMLFYYSFYAVAWILFAIGYIFFGVKLLGILPALMKGTVIRVSLQKSRCEQRLKFTLGYDFDGLIRSVRNIFGLSAHRHAG
jgi:hypothetical protein